MKIALTSLLLCLPAWSATLHVAPTGNDFNGTGQLEKPWRSVQRALDQVVPGDLVLVAPGDYGEYLQTRSHGTTSQRITLRANPPNDPARQAILRAIRLSHAHYTIEGFHFAGASDAHVPWGVSWGANIRIEPAASGSIITNNTIRDTPYVIASDFTFHHEDNSISSPSSDFLRAGFVAGSQIYLGSCSSIPYTNHNTRWIVKDLNAKTLWVTNGTGSRFHPDPGSNYWAAVHAGGTSGGFPAIAFIPSGGAGATDCALMGNTLTNVFGSAMDIQGSNHLIEGNYATRLNSYYAIRLLGSNVRVRGNTWINLRNILWYTGEELRTIPHPAGSGWYDYQVGSIHSVPQPGASVTNNILEFNWFENIENQLGNTAYGDIARDITFRNNVFVGVGSQANGGRHGLTWIHNTFYRCSYDISRTVVIATGGRNGDQIVSGINISSNLFIAGGDRSRPTFEGYYAISPYSTNVTTRGNFVAGPEITGWQSRSKFTEPDGINGGDPLFVDEHNPLGPDGLPFTADDGLRPLPHSPAALRGLGALAPIDPSESRPIAHFSLQSPVGWHEPLGHAFDPSWGEKTPWERLRPIRPYTTVDALPLPPCEAQFSAEGSFPGANATIDEYRWDFGDGTVVTTTSPAVRHTFVDPGTYWVTLTVRNSLLASSSVRRPYRIPGEEVNPRPGRPLGFRIVGR